MPASQHPSWFDPVLEALARIPRRGLLWMALTLSVAGGAVGVRSVVSGPGFGPMPGAAALVTASIAYLAGMMVYAASWASLFPDRRARGELSRRFLISQPAKYVPGGVVQPIGQVLAASDVSSSPVRPLVAFPVHVAVNVAAATTVAQTLLWSSQISPMIKAAVLSGAISLTLLYRPLMTRTLGMVASLVGRPIGPDSVPAQRRILAAFGRGVLAHSMMAAAFALVGGALSVPAPALVGAYAAAWLVGYAAVPLPAGIGAREAVLVVLLAGSAGAGSIAAVALIHRAVTVLADVGLAIGAGLRLGKAPRAESDG